MKRITCGVLALSLLTSVAIAQEPKLLPDVFWLKCNNTGFEKDSLLFKFDRTKKLVHSKVPIVYQAQICIENDDAILVSNNCKGIETGDGRNRKSRSLIFNKWDGRLTIGKERYRCDVLDVVAPRYK